MPPAPAKNRLRTWALLTGIIAGAFAIDGRAASATGTDARPAVHIVVAAREQRHIRLTLVVFSDRTFSLRVIDNANGTDNKPRFASLADAMKTTGAVAGCNGGFFNRQPFAPAALLISDRGTSGVLDRKNWMKGVLVIRDGQPGLEPASTFDLAGNVSAAVQSGPWLAGAHRLDSELDNRAMARRTFVGHDGNGTWALGATDPCTMRELADALAGNAVKEKIQIASALNLDGGPSTGLWAAQDRADLYLRERPHVQNFVAVVRGRARYP